MGLIQPSRGEWANLPYSIPEQGRDVPPGGGVSTTQRPTVHFPLERASPHRLDSVTRVSQRALANHKTITTFTLSSWTVPDRL